VALSRDGKALASCSEIQAHVWDVVAGKELRRWEDARRRMPLSPDGKILALGGSDKALDRIETDFQIHLWEVDTGKEMRRLPVRGEEGAIPLEAARCAAFSPDGKLLAVGDVTNVVHVWEVASGRELYRSAPFRNWVTCLAFSPDGKTLAVGAWLQILLW